MQNIRESGNKPDHPTGSTRRRIPGTADHFRQLREINDRIAVINTSIKELKDRIGDAIQTERTNSPRSRLIVEKQRLGDELTMLAKEKDGLHEEKKRVLPAYMQMKKEMADEKQRMNIRESVAEIDARIGEINRKIIQTTLTTQQESGYAKELSELKKKRGFCEGLRGREAELSRMNDELARIGREIAERARRIDGIRTAMNGVKDELARLKETRVKNSAIDEMDSQISRLRKEKDELIEKKKKVHQQIQEKEEEHNRAVQEMERQMRIEGQRKEIMREIREKEGRKNDLLRTIQDIDPYKFDVLASELRNVQDDALPLPLVKALAQLGIGLPRNGEERQALIDGMGERKRAYERSILEKRRVIEQSICEIDRELARCKEELSSMPVVDVQYKRKL